MIGQIAKKEIHHNLYSIRFPALLVISAVLFILNGIVAVTEPVQEVSSPRPNTVGVTISRQHDRLQFCARGNSADRIQSVSVRIGGTIAPRMERLSRLPVGERLVTFALPYADHIDWVFIIKIIFSLFAIIFTFDAVCWEREQGTLTLMCANPVSRSCILLGKYLGACFTLLVPLVMGIIINLLIVVIVGGILGNVSLQTEHWLRMGLLLLTSLVYISLFVLLGLLVSTAVRRPSSSLLILLTFWVGLVIVHPNLAGIVAEYASKTESEYQLSRRRRQILSSSDREAELGRQIKSGKIKTQEDFTKAAEELSINRKKAKIDIEARHREALIAKRRYARRIAMVSPAAIYQYVSESMADSGFERQQRFMRSLRDYYQVYENYVKEKVGRVIPYASWNFVMNYEGFRGAFSPPSESYKGDMSDFPYFSEPRWSINDSLRTVLGDLAILFLWNVLFFVAAHYVFVKRSLR